MSRSSATRGTPPGASASPRLSIAPMLDWTDRHFRFMFRLISREALLYSEMIHVNALLHGAAERHLAFDAAEHPVAVQLGGDDPESLAQGARIVQEWGYDEVNLNVGCPSSRVTSGNFGACLMADPERVRDCLAAMRGAVSIPVTVKHRIGIDDRDAYDDMRHFVSVVAESGVQRFTVHARKAWLKGLSPKENREIPPLRYEDVYGLKRDFPQLTVELNGGVRDLDVAIAHLARVDSVMIGRLAYEDPFALAATDRVIFGADSAGPSRRECVEAMIPYVAERLAEGTPFARVARHMLNLMNGRPGARRWRRVLSEGGHLPGADERLLARALEQVPDWVLDERAESPQERPVAA